MSATTLRLLLATNTTQKGPRFRGDAQQTVVEYDFHDENGMKAWGTIVFSDVLQFEFRPMPCCTKDDIVGSTEVRVQAASPRLNTIIERWQQAVGWQEWQEKQGGAARYQHFTIFFDDAGCVDVIAASCQIHSSA